MLRKKRADLVVNLHPRLFDSSEVGLWGGKVEQLRMWALKLDCSGPQPPL
jgi:hypothetical protein